MARNARALLLLPVLALLFALIPAAVLAQQPGERDEGLLLRVNGPVTVGADETVDNVIVIGDNATVDGTITGILLVVNGDAVVRGEVEEDVVVIRGTLTLESTSRVNDVAVARGELERDQGATVTGSINEGDFQVSPWDWGIFWAFIWLGSSVVVLVAGLIFAGVGGRQVKAAGSHMVNDLGPTLLGILVAWIVLPVLMILVFFTLVGIPLSISYFLFALPILWFLGYLVAGTQLGRLIVSSRANDAHPYLPALLGLIILQVISIIPFLGGLIAFLAGLVGSGALLVLAWRAWRGRGTEPEPAPVQTTSPTPTS